MNPLEQLSDVQCEHCGNRMPHGAQSIGGHNLCCEACVREFYGLADRATRHPMGRIVTAPEEIHRSVPHPVHHPPAPDAEHPGAGGLR